MKINDNPKVHHLTQREWWVQAVFIAFLGICLGAGLMTMLAVCLPL